MPQTTTRPIRIVLVDDHPVVREGLRAILSSFREISIAGEASSGREAIELSRELKPDVIVMDISMPEMSGIEATAILTREMPQSKVLALTMHDNRAYATQALRAGARAYVLKDTAPKDLVNAISSVFSGSILSPQTSNDKDPAAGAEGLSLRELEVLRCIARGCRNKEIGYELGLSVRTIETYRQSLIHKTGCQTVAELTRYAVNHGYFDLHSPL